MRILVESLSNETGILNNYWGKDRDVLEIEMLIWSLQKCIYSNIIYKSEYKVIRMSIFLERYLLWQSLKPCLHVG